MQKKPEHRFADGMQLHDFVWRNTMGQSRPADAGDEQLTLLQQENERLRGEKAALQTLLERMQETVRRQPAESTQFGNASYPQPAKKSNLLSNSLAILLPLIALGALAYFYFKYNNPLKNPQDNNQAQQQVLKTDSLAITAPKIITTHRNDDIETQLRYASAYLKQNNYEAALSIYRNLIKRQVPEAMYNYGNLALQNINKDISCNEALDWIDKAAKAEFVPAKTTLGFVYAFADDPEILRQNGYEACAFKKNITRGSKLLMEAMLQGDSTASLLLDELNTPAAAPADSTAQ
jgi:TPR repeat protein